MRTGQGTYYFANGNRYVGDWRDDMRQGVGICFYPAMNCKYVGEWENDRRHGKVRIFTILGSREGAHMTLYYLLVLPRKILTMKC